MLWEIKALLSMLFIRRKIETDSDFFAIKTMTLTGFFEYPPTPSKIVHPRPKS